MCGTSRRAGHWLRAGHWRLGGLVLIIAVLAFTRLRDRPEDVGLLPDGGPPVAPQSSVSTIQALRRLQWLRIGLPQSASPLSRHICR